MTTKQKQDPEQERPREGGPDQTVDQAPAAGVEVPTPGRIVHTSTTNPWTNAAYDAPAIVVAADQTDDGVTVIVWEFQRGGMQERELTLHASKADAQASESADVAWWPERS